MAVSGSLQLSLEFGGICRNHERNNKRFRLQNVKTRGQLCLLSSNLPSISLQQYSWSSNVSKRIHRRVCTIPCRNNQFRCHCFLNPVPSLDVNSVKNATLTLARSLSRLQVSPLVMKLASSVGIIVFAIWGLAPLVRQSRNIFFHKSDNSWKKSRTYQVTTSYIQPLLLWTGAMFICRTLEPMIVGTEAGQIVKQRLLNFFKSLSTVLAAAYCLSSVIQQAHKFFMEKTSPADTRNMGFHFAGKAVYSAVWIAAVSLFMELLGFSTQKWLTAGGLGTVLLTLAGREIFTNFLSSAMIHATRPFVVNEWIQTKIEGYEVSGTVEHVGWWSPTIIRGEDREAIHIPNHKFTVNVVRNLTQKTHWRIKTHLAISHLDVSKINNIVADMRKVLAKNPHVEQQKLHRRVFLDNINPENQGLMILVSCFVKTSHHEEYLCVKEGIFLDLLRVIKHHRARLATPIRTVQKIFTEADLDNTPFSSNRNLPFLLVEPSLNKVNPDDNKTKSQPRSPREEDKKPTTTTKSTSDNNNKVDGKGETTLSTDPKLNNNGTKPVSTKTEPKPPPVNKQQPSLEENIVLGVALEGSKRTLPIEEEVVSQSNQEEVIKEMATMRSSGNGSNVAEKDKNNNDVKSGDNKLDEQD